MTMRREEAEACLSALRSRPWPPSKGELDMLRRVSDLAVAPTEPTNVRPIRQAEVVPLRLAQVVPLQRPSLDPDLDPLPAA